MKLKTFFTEHAIDPEVTEGLLSNRPLMPWLRGCRSISVITSRIGLGDDPPTVAG
jgi:hypothetical protein